METEEKHREQEGSQAVKDASVFRQYHEMFCCPLCGKRDFGALYGVLIVLTWWLVVLALALWITGVL